MTLMTKYICYSHSGVVGEQYFQPLGGSFMQYLVSFLLIVCKKTKEKVSPVLLFYIMFWIALRDVLLKWDTIT